MNTTSEVPEPEFDSSGYPTEGTLEVIRKWPMETYANAHDLMLYCQRAWSDYGFLRCSKRRTRPWKNSKILEWHWTAVTGGWSGNESILSALEDNTMFWMVCWEMSERGGRHEFRTV